MSRRDDRPYVHAELGIPYDEYQMACWMAAEGAVDQFAARLCRESHRWWRPRLLSRIPDQADDVAAQLARRSSAALRRAVARTR